LARPGLSKKRLLWRLARLASWGSALMIAAVFSAAAYSLMHDIPPWSDEAAFFAEANWIAERGGPVGLVDACLKGEYRFHNTNPGVQVMLSTFIERTLDSVRPARLFESVVAALGLILIYALSKRSLGAVGALILAGLLGASVPWVHTAKQVTAEPLIYAFFFAGWLSIAGLRRPQTVVKERSLFIAGLIVGAAWWIKASALLLPVAAVAALLPYWIAVRCRHRRCWSVRTVLAHSGLFAGGFLCITWPLLLDRYLLTGNPFFSYPGVYLWLDSWDQHHLYLQGLQDFSFSSWVSTHTLGEAWARLTGGLQTQLSHAIRLFETVQLNRTLQSSLGAALIALSLWGLGTLRSLWARAFTATLLLLSILLLSWYSHTAVRRLSAIIGPIIGFLLISGAGDLWHRLRRLKPALFPPWSRLCLRGAVACGVSVLTLSILGKLTLKPEGLVSPGKPFRVSASYTKLLDCLRQEVLPTKSVCLQVPNLSPYFQVRWLLGHDELFINIPPLPDFATFNEYAAKRDARYLILAHGEALESRMYLFVDPQQGAELRLPGWRLSFTDPYRHWLIFEREK
jgi:hypothetical protein